MVLITHHSLTIKHNQLNLPSGIDTNNKNVPAGSTKVKQFALSSDLIGQGTLPFSTGPKTSISSMQQKKEAWATVTLKTYQTKSLLESLSLAKTLKASAPTTTSSGCASLTTAVRTNNLIMVSFFHKLGVDLNAEDSIGNIPFVVAAQEKNLDMVRLLKKLGANINAEDAHGDTALLMAVRRGMITMVSLLKELGADFNVKNCRGITPMAMAMHAKDLFMLNLLVLLGSDPLVINQDGYNLLMFARLTEQSSEIIETLMRLGLNKKKRLSTKMINEKIVAAMWGLKGKIKWTDHNEKSHEYDLEGLYLHFGVKLLSDYVSTFFTKFSSLCSPSPPGEDVLIKEVLKGKCDEGHLATTPEPSKYVIKIQQALARAYPLVNESPKNVLKTLYDSESNEPYIILGGISGHAIALVLCNKKLTICNRGSGRETRPHSCEEFALPSKALTTHLIDKLRKEYTNIETFYQMIDSLKLERIGGYNRKDQKNGNCVWASGKAAFGTLCREYFGKEPGEVIYKLFTTYSRMKSLEDYLKHPDLVEASISEQITQKKIVKGID